MSKLQIMDRSGHTTVEWCPDLEETVAAANRRFDELVQQGYTGFIPGGENAGQIREFDSTASEIVMIPRMVGG